MELFNKYKNRDVIYLRNYINSVLYDPKKALSPEALQSALDGPDEAIGAILFKKDDHALPLRDSVLTVRTSTAERAWLKKVLTDPKADLFLSPALKEKLQKRLAADPSVPDLATYLDVRKASRQASFTDIAPAFRRLVQALEEGRYVDVVNESNKGPVYHNHDVIPHKLEYDIRRDRFYFSCFPTDAGRPVKMDLKRLTSVTLGRPIEDYDKKIAALVKEQLYMMREAVPVRLKIADAQDALDRCAYLFSAYDTVCHRTEEGDLVMDVTYYQFQRQSLVRLILYLGPYATVVSPEDMRAEIIDLVRRSYESYSEET